MECHKGFFRCSAELGRFCDSQRDDHKKKTPGPNGQAPSTWWLCLRSPQGTVSGIIKKSDLTLLFFLFVFLLNRFITQLDWKLVSWGRKSIFLYILNFQHLVGGLAWKYSWVFFFWDFGGGFQAVNLPTCLKAPPETTMGVIQRDTNGFWYLGFGKRNGGWQTSRWQTELVSNLLVCWCGIQWGNCVKVVDSVKVSTHFWMRYGFYPHTNSKPLSNIFTNTSR